MTRENLLKKIYGIYQTCKSPDWDKCNSMPISEDTYKHAIRFVSKLEKYNVSIENIKVSPLNDDNLNFCWSYDDGTSFNIDFDRSNDTLIWCCYKDEKHIWDGVCIHFEDIVENLMKFINFHEGNKQ